MGLQCQTINRNSPAIHRHLIATSPASARSSATVLDLCPHWWAAEGRVLMPSTGEALNGRREHGEGCREGGADAGQRCVSAVNMSHFLATTYGQSMTYFQGRRGCKGERPSRLHVNGECTASTFLDPEVSPLPATLPTLSGTESPVGCTVQRSGNCGCRGTESTRRRSLALARCG